MQKLFASLYNYNFPARDKYPTCALRNTGFCLKRGRGVDLTGPDTQISGKPEEPGISHPRGVG